MKSPFSNYDWGSLESSRSSISVIEGGKMPFRAAALTPGVPIRRYLHAYRFADSLRIPSALRQSVYSDPVGNISARKQR